MLHNVEKAQISLLTTVKECSLGVSNDSWWVFPTYTPGIPAAANTRLQRSLPVGIPGYEHSCLWVFPPVGIPYLNH